MQRRTNCHVLIGVIATAAMTVMLAGCSSTSNSGDNFPPPGAATANGQPTCPPPKVADCALTSVGSPQKFICNGKPYTSFDLAKLRTDCERQQGAQ